MYCLLFSSILLIYFSLLLCYLLIYFPSSFYKFQLSLPILSLSHRSNWISCLLCYILRHVLSLIDILSIYIVQTFPSVVSFQLLHKQSDLKYIFSCSIIVFFMYYFLPHLSFSIARHFVFVLPIISSIILFLPLTSLFSSHFFPCAFFLACYFIYFNLMLYCFCKKCCCNSFFVLLTSSWFVYLRHCSLFYGTTSVLHIVFSILQAIFLFLSCWPQ